MIERQSIKFALGASLLLAGAAFTSDCGQEEGQPARESISAPRGNSPGKGEEVKDKAAGAGKAGAAAKPEAEKKGL